MDIGTWFQQTASDGSMLLAIPVAAVAGLVSFFSPCVLPLVPGYLSYVSGLSAVDIIERDGGRGRGRLVLGATLFVLGFSTVYVILGGLFGQLGGWLLTYSDELNRALGIILILLGLVFMGSVSWLQRDMRFHKIPAVGLWAAPIIGALFGVGWTPCVGPTLSAILGLGGVYGANPSRSSFLAFIYCLGLGLPFILAAASFSRASRAIGWARRHQPLIARFGGCMLILIGILLVTGWWDYLVDVLQGSIDSTTLPV